MVPACCFCQRTYVAQGYVNGALNETQTHSRLLVEVTRACATYVLWWKQQAGNIHVCKDKINNSLKNANL